MVENPYFGLFRGEDVSYNAITACSPGMRETIRALVKTGTVVGQATLWEDVILWMPGKKREVANMNELLDKVMIGAKESRLGTNGLPK